MKKDLTKYYAVVEPKDCIRVCNVLGNPLITPDTVRVYIEDGLINLFLNEYNGDFTLSSRELPTRTKISLKTLQNYIMLNNKIDRSFTEPKELRKLTEENTTLANGNKELLQKCVFLENEVQRLKSIERKKEEVISIQNDMLEVKELENETLKKELNAKSVALIIVSFTLTIALIFIAQKL